MPKQIAITEDSANDILAELDCDTEAEPIGSPHNGNGQHRPGSFDAVSFLAAHGVKIQSTKQDSFGTKHILAECPFDPSHKAPDSYVTTSDKGHIFHCSHNSCAGKKWQDVRLLFEPTAYDRKTQPAVARDVDQSARPLAYERITAAELDAGSYALEYLIDAMLVKGQPQIVAGGKKCLKTNLLCDAVISLASGLPFLGKFRVGRKVRTAFMSGESGLHTIQETCRRICHAKDIALAEIDGLLFSTDLPRIGDARHQAALERFIADDLGVELLVLDPAYLCLPGGDAGNLFIQGEMLRDLAAICQAKGVTLILCHHTRKGGIADPFEPPELEHIAWAGFQEFARGWWLVGRREKYEPGTGLHRLWLSVGGSAGHSSLWGLDINEGQYDPGKARVWQVDVLTAQDSRESAKRQAVNSKQAKTQDQLKQDVAALLDVAARWPAGETKNILKTAAGLSGTRANLAIASALKSGRLVLCNVTKDCRRTPFEGMKPAPKQGQSDQSD